MGNKHEPYKRSDGFWSCRVCKWKFETRPNKKNCPGILRIERATNEYKTDTQWVKLGFEPIVLPGHVFPVADAVSIVHSTTWYRYFHKDHVKAIEPLAPAIIYHGKSDSAWGNE